MQTKIVGIYIDDRADEAEKVQHILTEYGCSIKTRLGLHEAGTTCSPHGIVLLQLIGDQDEWQKLESELSALEGVDVNSMLLGS